MLMFTDFGKTSDSFQLFDDRGSDGLSFCFEADLIFIIEFTESRRLD